MTREVEKKATAATAAFDRAVSDLEFQIRDLRAALAHHEQSIEEEQKKAEQAIGEPGKLADHLETELAALFKELEGGGGLT